MSREKTEEQKSHALSYQREYYQKHIEKERRQSRLYHQLHRERENARNSVWGAKLKLEVFSHYSNGEPKCAICGEKNLAFLALDHINNDGTEHHITNKYGYGTGMWSWARKNNFPPIFQVLCRECNIIKAYPSWKVILVAKSLGAINIDRKQLSDLLIQKRKEWKTAYPLKTQQDFNYRILIDEIFDELVKELLAGSEDKNGSDKP